MAEREIVSRVVWRRSSPLAATLHYVGCRVLDRNPASGKYATHQPYTAEEARERVASEQHIGLCAICGTRQEFA